MPRKLSKNPLPPSTSTVSSISTTSTSSNPGLSLLPASLADPSLPLPKLIVFDLDYTLWPFWVDTHFTPPPKVNASHTSVTDRYGEEYSFFEDVPDILYALPRAGCKIGVASRTSAPSLARDLLKMLHVTAPEGGKPEKPKKAIDVFEGLLEIYPGCKIKHFESLQKRTGIKYEDMLFFDDEARNRDTESLGVTMYLVRDGVSWKELERGVTQWRNKRGYLKRPEAVELA
ncbi:magnesium dependent phosphatase [Fusarium heterosporum]|uniref:Magnesium dependent phosphatase n=1 Tax=Fusarium heterosporum TaxID=42747 RepID=A0A8H5TH53_FUSHE|nr:magnesium dependent phosphatase [Fusarium heterosporum]